MCNSLHLYTYVPYVVWNLIVHLWNAIIRFWSGDTRSNQSQSSTSKKPDQNSFAGDQILEMKLPYTVNVVDVRRGRSYEAVNAGTARE